MSVFKVTSDYKTIINKDAAKLVPELRLLTEDELIFCILVADDVDGPFRKKPPDERVLMALKRYPDIKAESKKMKLAIDGYKSLIFDQRRRTVEILTKRIRIIDIEIETDMAMSASKMGEKLKMQEMLQKRVDAIQSEIDADEMAYEIKGGKKLSFLEKYQMNQKKYREFQNAL
jgi:hypothetical protein